MYGKSNMKTYITICKIDNQQEFVVWLRKLKQYLDLFLSNSLKRCMFLWFVLLFPVVFVLLYKKTRKSQ